MESLGKCFHEKQFEKIFVSLSLTLNNNGKEIIDLSLIYNKFIEEKLIIEILNN